MSISFVIIMAVLAVIAIVYGYYIHRLHSIITRRAASHLSKIEIVKETAPSYKLRSGGTYLVFEPDQSGSLGMVRGVLKGGGRALYITRVQPGRRGKEYAEGSQFIWLSQTEGAGAVRPTQLGLIIEDVRAFIRSRRNTVVHLGALEFVIFHNEFERVMLFLQNMQDETSIGEGRLVISLDASGVDRDHLRRLEKELKVIGGGRPAPKRKD